MSAEIQYTTADCHQCGDEFQSGTIVSDVLGRMTEFSQLRCDSCLEKYDAHMAIATGDKKAPQQWSDICPPMYADFTAAKLPQPGLVAWIKVELVAWFDDGKGVGLIGPSFGGKSMIIHELARRVWAEGKDVMLTTGTEFAFCVGNFEQAKRREYVERACKVDVLLIDDVGKEKITDRSESDLYHVLEQRRRHLRPILVTLNSSGDDLAASMSEDRATPIVNRLREMCEFIVVGETP